MNNNKIAAFCCILVSFFMVACGHAEYKKTKTGLAYEIISDGKGKLIQHKNFVKIHLKFMIGDSVLENTYDHIPAYGMVDTSMKDEHHFTDILPMMRTGDSAIIVMSMDTLKKMHMIAPTDSSFKPGGTKKCYVKVLNIFSDEAALRADYEKEEAMELTKESAKLEQYLKEKNISATKTPKGAFVQITEQGTGPAVDSGKQVSVLYHGTNIKGQVFDSTKDSAFGHVNQPIEFVVGTGRVILGWDEGLKYFKQGGKGKIYIPAMMAYKNQSPSKVIQPYSDLIFEVEVVKVTNAPKMPSPPTPPVPVH